MSVFRTLAISAMAIVGASAAPPAMAPAMAQSPGLAGGPEAFQGRGPGFGSGFEFASIMGARVDAAKDTLRSRGFTHARNIRASGQQYDLWWSGRRCIGFTSYNGRVSDVRDFRDEECGYSGGPGGGPGGGPDWGGGGFNTRVLEGLRVDSAKSTLRDRGFNHVRSVRIDGRQYDLWWSGRTCVGFTSYNGRVTIARTFSAPECGGTDGGFGGGRFNPRELEGLRVDSAKDTLRRYGFDYERAIRIDGRQYDLWSSGGRRNGCVGFTSYNGRVTDARSFDGRECY